MAYDLQIGGNLANIGLFRREKGRLGSLRFFAMKQCFLGQYEHAIDKQRRIAIPREWRGKDKMVFYLLPGRDQTVQILPEKLFMEEVYEKARKVSFASRGKGQALANIGKFAHRSVCDKQGRISLTPLLMEHAQLEDSGLVQLTGSITKIELRRHTEEQSLIDGIEQFLDEMEAIQGLGDE